MTFDRRTFRNLTRAYYLCSLDTRHLLLEDYNITLPEIQIAIIRVMTGREKTYGKSHLI